MINQIQFLIWLKALGFRRNIVYLLWLNPCCRVWLVGVKGKQKYCWDSDAYLGQSIKKCFLELYHLLFVYISLCWSPFRSETPAAVIIKRFRITLCVICHWSHTNSEVCLAYSRNCGDSLQFTLLTLGCERPQFLIRHLGIWPFRLWVCFFFLCVIQFFDEHIWSSFGPNGFLSTIYMHFLICCMPSAVELTKAVSLAAVDGYRSNSNKYVHWLLGICSCDGGIVQLVSTF